jgi:hypothetical protein
MLLVSNCIILDVKIRLSMVLGLFGQVSCVVTFAILAQPLLVLGAPFFLIGRKLLPIVPLVLLAA